MARRKKGEKVDGWIVLDKPLGLGSTPAVGRVRRLFGAQKAGHGGTLDPLASGILPIALGEATKTVPFIMDARKEYRFTLRFGEARSTEDAEGEVTATSDLRPGDAAIEAALPAFLGEIEQRPPAFSALKIDGKRAYDLARAGESVELKLRQVLIERLESLLPVRTVRQIGARAPLHVTSNGKAILAALPQVERDAYVAGNLEPYTPRSLRSPNELREDLDLINNRGFALSDGELDLEVRAVAAAIMSGKERPVGAMSISCPAQRLPPEHVEQFGLMVAAAARRVSERLAEA